MASGSQKVTTYSSNTLIPKINSASLSDFKDDQNLIYTFWGGGNRIGDKPTGVNAFGAMSFKTADGYYGQLLMSADSATGLYWRTASSLSGGWHKVLDSSNYTDYAATAGHNHDSRYVNVEGDTMVGTGTSTDEQWVTLTIGNNKAVGTAGNYSGQVKFYNNLGYSQSLKAARTTLTANRNVMLPAKDATCYLVDTTGTGATGTWNISISGNAATATKAARDGAGNTIDSTYLKLSGGTLTGPLIINKSLDAGLDSGSGPLIIGNPSGQSMGIDNNEIIVRYDGAPGILYLQAESGGSLITKANTTIRDATLTVDGTINNYKLYVGGAINADDVRTSNGIWICNAAITNAPTTNHGALFGMGSVGTPCQFYMPDESYYIYKRYYNNSSSSWNDWGKVYAGYADSAGTATWANYLSNASHSVTIDASDWQAANPWGASNRILVWGQEGVTSASGDTADITLFYGTTPSSGGAGWFLNIDGGFYSLGPTYGAAWNDYAEFRKSNIFEGGRVITPIGECTTKRLEAGTRIVSDTYGYAIGYMENQKDNAPIALSGRVLAYPYKDKSEYKIGDAVCSAPGGTIDIMTREEIMMYPDRIIGIVNEIPDYDIWEPSLTGNGHGPVHTNGRIWIDVH